MVPFEFQPRTRVIFGPGTLDRLGYIARDLGWRRALIVSDPGIVEAGHARAAAAALEAADIHTFLFQEVRPNPDTRMVEAGRDHASSLGIDAIVAVGGGSALDAAKAINLLVANGGRVADHVGYARTARPLLPMAAVPTTAGAGSEAQSSAVIVDAGSGVRIAIGAPEAAFRLAILDPVLTGTAPRHVAAMAGFDALAHAVEAAAATRRTPLSDTFAYRAWQLLAEAFERVLLHPADIEARSAMQIGAWLAGLAAEHSALGAAHACANPLTARYAIGHGLALAMLLPHVVRWNGVVAHDRYAALLGTPRRRARDEDPVEALARRLEDLASAASLGLRLSEAGVSPHDLPELAASAAGQPIAAFNPRPLDVPGAIDVYRAAM